MMNWTGEKAEKSNSILLPTDLLLWATIGNQVDSVTDLQWLKAPIHQWWVKLVKIWLKIKFPIITHQLTGC